MGVLIGRHRHQLFEFVGCFFIEAYVVVSLAKELVGWKRVRLQAFPRAKGVKCLIDFSRDVEVVHGLNSLLFRSQRLVSQRERMLQILDLALCFTQAAVIHPKKYPGLGKVWVELSCPLHHGYSLNRLAKRQAVASKESFIGLHGRRG